MVNDGDGPQVAQAIMAVVNRQAQQPALIPYVVEVDAQPGGDPDGADWKGAESYNWLEDADRQRYHARGVRAYRAGNLALWVACDCAHKIVGLYARGATSAFATDIARSVDTVENMAHASALYLRLWRDFRGASEDGSLGPLFTLIVKLRALRRKLSYTHFSEMWSLWKSDPSLTALAVFADLETAAANGISSRGLKEGGQGQQGKTAVAAAVHALKSDYVLDLVQNPDDAPPDTYIVVLQGNEWAGVDLVKVRPA